MCIQMFIDIIRQCKKPKNFLKNIRYHFRKHGYKYRVDYFSKWFLLLLMALKCRKNEWNIIFQQKIYLQSLDFSGFNFAKSEFERQHHTYWKTLSRTCIFLKMCLPFLLYRMAKKPKYQKISNNDTIHFWNIMPFNYW